MMGVGIPIPIDGFARQGESVIVPQSKRAWVNVEGLQEFVQLVRRVVVRGCGGLLVDAARQVRDSIGIDGTTTFGLFSRGRSEDCDVEGLQVLLWLQH